MLKTMKIKNVTIIMSILGVPLLGMKIYGFKDTPQSSLQANPPDASPVINNTFPRNIRKTYKRESDSHIIHTLSKKSKEHIAEPSEHMNEQSLPNLSDSLSKQWDLKEIDAPQEKIAALITTQQPSSIVYYDGESAQHIYPRHYAEGEQQTDKTLYLGNGAHIQNIIEERKESSDLNTAMRHQSSNMQRPETLANPFHLAENAFEVAAFYAGKNDDNEVLVPIHENLLSALQGPNYSFDNYDYKDPVEVKRHLSNVLSLGHGGTLILKVKNSGILINDAGPDITIYQTTFKIIGTDTYFHKFAYLGVSDTLNEKDVQWFPCNPQDHRNLKGCIGVVPTVDGGDKFDLSDINIHQAKYIWIRDTGKNFKNKKKKSPWPTEGFTIDSIKLHHAYVN